MPGWKVFIATVAGALLVLWPFVILFDTDAYYHLAAAYWYLDHGWRSGLEWARLSAMADGFGDKELLFHVFLMPFVAVSRSTLAGKVALACLNGVAAVVLARLFSATLGRAAGFAHLAFALTSLDYSARLLRLRPELLSLPILLLAVTAAAAGRHRVLGLLAAVYALAYSGFHVLPLLCLLWFGWERVARRRWEPALLVWPLVGTLAGIVLHPQFPANVRVWLLQSVLRYFVDLPNAGAEMKAGFAAGPALFANSAWLLLLLLLWRSGRRDDSVPPEDDPRLREFTIVAAALFAAFYLLLPNRFGLYLVPLVTLALLLEMRRRGQRVSGRMRLVRGRTAPLALGLAACLAVGGVGVHDLVGNAARSQCFEPERPESARLFAQALPANARVAATWADAEWYTFWAPDARYLNVLDPVFMAVPHPDAYRASLSVFEGDQPDVPLVVGTTLESEYIAFSSVDHDELLARVAGDPRLRMLYAADNVLLALVPGANRSFVLDWRVAPPGTTATDATADRLAAWPPYPRFEGRGRVVEGFVDQRRLPPGPSCRLFARRLDRGEETRETWELSSWGPAHLWLDGRLVVGSLGGDRAVLGRGVVTEVGLDAGAHVVAVESCGSEGAGGFYLVERLRDPRPAS